LVLAESFRIVPRPRPTVPVAGVTFFPRSQYGRPASSCFALLPFVYVFKPWPPFSSIRPGGRFRPGFSVLSLDPPWPPWAPLLFFPVARPCEFACLPCCFFLHGLLGPADRSAFPARVLPPSRVGRGTAAPSRLLAAGPFFSRLFILHCASSLFQKIGAFSEGNDLKAICGIGSRAKDLPGLQSSCPARPLYMPPLFLIALSVTCSNPQAVLLVAAGSLLLSLTGDVLPEILPTSPTPRRPHLLRPRGSSLCPLGQRRTPCVTRCRCSI